MLSPAHSDLRKIQYTTSTEPFMTNTGEIVNPSDIVVVAEDKADIRSFKISEMPTGRWMNELLPVNRSDFEHIKRMFPNAIGCTSMNVTQCIQSLRRHMQSKSADVKNDDTQSSLACPAESVGKKTPVDAAT